MYSEVTKETIRYIEEHLQDDWFLEHYAYEIGYSKFHLSRIFKKETGQTISEYIRKRRLAIAAMYLLYSNESILDIAFSLQFQSQEAFTRSFKELYNMPPGKYRKLMRTISGMEENEMNQTTEVKGWMLSGSHPSDYRMETDDKIFHTGTKSGCLYATGDMGDGQFGTMMQSISADRFRGKRIKMSCYLKTEDVTKCGAWFRVDNQSGDVVQFDNMDNRSIIGTSDWNYYKVVLDVPAESASMHFGVLLAGQGKVWADGFRFEEVDETESNTNMMGSENLPDQPINLGFDE
ncbi:AraC family transcriptional regulator [Bacillus sp. E(2018)]|uniref:helix-turn-helix transcriptional regulator n=1 Tax=Bacillus sp. E(2018) TaxID=2502239 RepID=UPI0010F7D426|nr:AraC family transcriptional regulator [Bacillus sp. E(2018)]